MKIGDIVYAVTTSGFEYMMRTHGCSDKVDIIGYTISDEECPERTDQIKAWVAEYPNVSNWVAVDDLDLDLGDNFVKTDGKVGLTEEKAEEIIKKLNIGV